MSDPLTTETDLPEWMRDPFAVLARGRHLLEDPSQFRWVEEYEAWLADFCEHGVPPDHFCEDCDNRYREPWE